MLRLARRWFRDGGRTSMDDLLFSSELINSPRDLRAAMCRDGYVLIRGLLDPVRVTAARNSVLRTLAEGGWVDEKGALRNPDFVSEDSPAYRAALATAPFNRIPYLPELRRLMTVLLGHSVFPYPSKILRASPPQRHKTESGRYGHQDFAFWGVNDMMTSWVPLMDVPEALGGLALRPGSHLGPPVELRLMDPAEGGWATTDYKPGDVLVFHCLTAHAALPNTHDELRLSGDFRWQRSDEPVSRELVFGSVDGERELFADQFENASWWAPVPEDLPLTSRSTATTPPPGPSRLFPVHADWSSWVDPRSL
jgi:hypothetical protein